MKRKLLLTLASLVACVSSFATIYGPTSGCTGTTAYFYDSSSAPTSGVWSSSNTAIATIDASTGVAHPVSAGVTTISFTTALGTSTHTFTVYASPAPITAPTTTMCIGDSILCSNITAGGTWSTASSSVLLPSGTGMMMGIGGGYGTVYYTTGGGCSSSIVLTVVGGTPDPIMVPSTVCVGSTVTASDSTGGGTWNITPSTVAAITSGGVITGLSTGTAYITYTVTGTCGTYTTTTSISVISTSTAGTISGATSVTAGSTIPLSSTVSGGTWSVSPSSIATINATTGVLTGIAAGSAIVTYTTTGCGGIATTTYTVNVTPFDGIAGTVYFGSAAYYGPVKVWLITYSAPMLAAIDSAWVYCTSGSSVTYQFAGVPTNSYRVKAAVTDSLPTLGSTGYIPTYHTSSFYWSTADVIAHTSGTTDAGKDINMMTGTTTSGPGFVAGDVTTGANKGTTGGVPVNGLMMYIFDASNNLYQSVRTDASGHYSFSNLPYGTYYVFPDSLNYATTPYTSIVLSASASSYSAASFIQHTLSKTITPIPVAISNVTNAATSVVTFPNPTTGRVNIAWQMPVAEDATVVVTDVTGKVVYNSNLNMTQGAGSSQINLSNLGAGLYNIAVKSASINYNNKVQVQH